MPFFVTIYMITARAYATFDVALLTAESVYMFCKYKLFKVVLINSLSLVDKLPRFSLKRRLF